MPSINGYKMLLCVIICCGFYMFCHFLYLPQREAFIYNLGKERLVFGKVDLNWSVPAGMLSAAV